MKIYSLIAISALLLSACDSPAPVAPVTTLAGANPVIPIEAELAQVPVSKSLIVGEITLLNTNNPFGEVIISIRGSSLSTTRLMSGDFELELPMSENARSVTLDFTGSNVIDKSISVQIPANADLVSLEVDVAMQSPAILFNLDAGGVLQNPISANRTSVTVPANAFEFADGSSATGEAEVSITEIDIKNLDGASSWAPNLTGISDGEIDPKALLTFGMSDFHFSQDGKALQLRQGVNATIKMDLVTRYLTVAGSIESFEAAPGDVVPLWHFDTQDMIWKEEGQATVVADNASDTGLSATGEVSHFSTWNLDKWTPSMIACIVIELVDENGQPRDDLDLVSFMTTASIPLEEGPGWHPNETSWSNTEQMTPHDNKILVLANRADRAEKIALHDSITGYTTMDITIDNIVIDGYGRIDLEPIRTKKIFHDYDGDDTVVLQIMVRDSTATSSSSNSSATSTSGTVGSAGTVVSGGTAGGEVKTLEIIQSDFIEVPVVLTLPTVEVNVEVVIIDFFSQPRYDLTVESYRVTAKSDITSWANQQSMTPEQNQLIVQANDVDRIDANQPVTTTVSLDSVVVREIGDVNMLFTVTGSKVFTTFGNDKTIVLEVAIADE